MHRLQTFVNKCLRSILHIRWHDKVRNEELWERTGQERVEVQILCRKWGWIGHTLCKPDYSVTRQALKWNPQGKRNRGKPRATWCRSTEQELKATGKSWNGLEKLAKNRGKRRILVRDLCTSWRSRVELSWEWLIWLKSSILKDVALSTLVVERKLMELCFCKNNLT